MSEKLRRLVYYSKNRIAGDPAQVAVAIDTILAASRCNNPDLGLTGALLFNNGIFAQVLEGDGSAIEAVFEKIQQDQRHGDVQVLAFEPAREREFPRWSMAFLGRSREGQDLFGHIGIATGFTDASMVGERMLDLMRTIAIDEEQRTA